MKTLGKYMILEPLGAGGMGSVYRARDTVLEREVALKTIVTGPSADPETLQRFYREARAYAQLQHPNIVTIYDLGEQEDVAYIVMELLGGADLRNIIAERRPFPLETKVELAMQVCDGLAHAHGHGIVHRDIKPGNIFIEQGDRAKILDFGIARIASSKLTRVGAALGTPDYMAPEQIAGHACEPRSDLFSAAVVFFEFLVYEHPFGGRNIARRIVQEEPVGLRVVDPQMPEALAQVLAKGLAKQIDQRYQSADEFAAALRAVRPELRRPSAAVPQERSDRRQAQDAIIDALRQRAQHLLQSDPAACLRFIESLGVRQQTDMRIAEAREQAEGRLKEVPPRRVSMPSSPFSTPIAARMAAPPPSAVKVTTAAAVRPASPPRDTAVEEPPPTIRLVPASPPPRIQEEPAAPPPPPAPILKPLALPPPEPAHRRVVRRPVGMEPVHKRIAIGVGAVVFLAVASIAYSLRSRTVRTIAPIASAEVAATGAKLLSAPESGARALAALPRGTRVSILDLPAARQQQWVRAQYRSGSGSARDGFVKTADLKNWSSDQPGSALQLLKIFRPDAAATEDELKQALERASAFTVKFGIAPQGPEGNFERARVHLALARLGRQARWPRSEWQPHLDSATGQLAMAAANTELASQIEKARQELEQLKSWTEEERRPAPLARKIVRKRRR